MSQTEYQIKPGNIKSNSEETSSVSKIVMKQNMRIIKEIKAEEKPLITKTMSYCHAFIKNFKSSAKDDWVFSGI